MAIVLAAAVLPSALAAAPRLFEAPGAPHLRVLTWNIGANSIFPDPGPRGHAGDVGDRPARFARVVRAIDPDIACLQEVFVPRTAADVARAFDAAIPLPGGARWHAVGAPDIVIVSRQPLELVDAMSRDWGGGLKRTHVTALAQVPPELSKKKDLLVLCAHLQSKGEPKDVAARQAQADAIVAGLRALRATGRLPTAMPRVLLGDWNAYPTEAARHMDTLLTGAIADRARFGQHFAPDGDGTALCDPSPSRNAAGFDHTTFQLGADSPFPPGRLDRVLYGDSRLHADGGFVLDAASLDAALLQAHGLQAGDTLYSVSANIPDHLPVVVDFVAGPGAASGTCQ